MNQLYIYTCPLFFRFFSHVYSAYIGHYRVLSRVSVLYSRSLLVSILYIVACELLLRSLYSLKRPLSNRLVVAKGRGVGEGRSGSLGLADENYYIYIKWINSKVLLNSTGNYIQYPVINHTGKEY